MTRLRLFMVHCAILTATACPDRARASEPVGVIGAPLRVGVIAGYHLTSADIDVMGDRVPEAQPGDAPLFGLRVGVRLTAFLEVELSAAVAPAPTGDRGTAWLMPTHLDLVVRPLEGPVRPTLTLGAGFIANPQGPGDVDALLFGALGVEIALGPMFALRVEAGLHATDGVEAALSWSPLFVIGLDVLAWRARRADLPSETGPALFGDRADRRTTDDADPDGDGLTGDADLCPFHAGPLQHRGCPDTDGDGLADPFDRCPAAAGPRATGGCPDRDNDGVPDREDACPDLPGPRDRYGCP